MRYFRNLAHGIAYSTIKPHTIFIFINCDGCCVCVLHTRRRHDVIINAAYDGGYRILKNVFDVPASRHLITSDELYWVIIKSWFAHFIRFSFGTRVYSYQWHFPNALINRTKSQLNNNDQSSVYLTRDPLRCAMCRRGFMQSALSCKRSSASSSSSSAQKWNVT